MTSTQKRGGEGEREGGSNGVASRFALIKHFLEKYRKVHDNIFKMFECGERMRKEKKSFEDTTTRLGGRGAFLPPYDNVCLPAFFLPHPQPTRQGGHSHSGEKKEKKVGLSS